MALLNYSTEIDPDKTAGEIATMLRKAGAQAVLTEYDPGGNYVSALSFRIDLNGQMLQFRLPTNPEPVLRTLKDQYENSPRVHGRKRWRGPSPDHAHAVRVAWRIIKDWTEAQLALIETQMVTAPQAFLQYAVMKDGRTLAERISEDPQFLLGHGTQP